MMIDDIVFVIQNIAIVFITVIIFEFSRFILNFLTSYQKIILLIVLYLFLYFTRHSTFNFLRDHGIKQ
jgi:hypothetical protein